MRLLGNTPHIWSRDPALDASDPAKLETALREFREKGDASKLPLKPGRQPVVWQLRSLSETAYNDFTRTSLFELQRTMPRGVSALFDQATYATCREAARRGIQSAEGAMGENRQPLDLPLEEGAKERALAHATMEALYKQFGPRLIGELGQRVIELSEMDPT